MARSPDSIRRWLGGICLSVAALMLIAGTTFLQARLRDRAFIYYWLACLSFTCLTLIIALLDFRAVRLRSRREQRELIENALMAIEQEKARIKDVPASDRKNSDA